jgi:hypothetical protein
MDMLRIHRRYFIQRSGFALGAALSIRRFEANEKQPFIQM